MNWFVTVFKMLIDGNLNYKIAHMIRAWSNLGFFINILIKDNCQTGKGVQDF